MKNFWKYLNIFLLCICSILLIGLQQHWAWLLWAIGIFLIFFCSKDFVKDFLLIYISMGLLGITAITTDISYKHMVFMAITLSLAVVIPYLISRYIYKDYAVRFRFHHGRKWYRSEIMYIIATGFLSYLILPFYLRNTGAYLNWTVNPGLSNITRLFAGTNALGIWDELFFISTVLGIFRRHFGFILSNICQSVLFTAFLFELGFTGWGFIMIYVFAFVQGIVFKKTESLFYVITIHLTMDLVLFFALINAYHPSWVHFFIT